MQSVLGAKKEIKESIDCTGRDRWNSGKYRKH